MNFIISFYFNSHLSHSLVLHSIIMNVVNFNNNRIQLMNHSSKDQNRKLRRNTIVFGIMMILSQIGISIVYGVTFQINSSVINISSIVTVIALAILVIGGFGLVFSYMKRLVWSGIGFTFFITAFCIEFYPLINDFWTKTRIDYTATPTYFQNTNYELYLSNANIPSSKLYGNCITNAIKCALAVAAAFSSILGRAGPLECFFTVIFGTIGFQLNRQVIGNLSVDGFGSYSIFTFGGFMGLAMGTILKLKEDKTEGCSTGKHTFNTASPFSVSYAILGSLIILALFPVLAYQIDVTNNFNLFNLYNGPVSIILGMGASIIASFLVSALINGNVIIRDIIHAPIAGGIVVGSASMFITNPVYALVAGFAGGAMQTLIQNFIQKTYLQKKSVISSISWSLFGIQGLIGGVFATGYKRIIDLDSNGFFYTNPSSVNFNPGYQLLIAVISAGIGLGFGAIAGLIIYCVTGHKSEDHFTDRPYWISDDGLTYPKARELEQAKKKINVIDHIPIPPQSDKQPKQRQAIKEQHSEILPLPDVLSGQRSQFQFQFQMDFSEGQELPNNYHAYL